MARALKPAIGSPFEYAHKCADSAVACKSKYAVQSLWGILKVSDATSLHTGKAHQNLQQRDRLDRANLLWSVSETVFKK